MDLNTLMILTLVGMLFAIFIGLHIAIVLGMTAMVGTYFIFGELGIPFTPVGGGDSLMGWTARQIWYAMVADDPLPGLIIRGRFRRWMSGSGATPDAGTISIGCVGRTGLHAHTADGLGSRG